MHIYAHVNISSLKIGTMLCNMISNVPKGNTMRKNWCHEFRFLSVRHTQDVNKLVQKTDGRADGRMDNIQAYSVALMIQNILPNTLSGH